MDDGFGQSLRLKNMMVHLSRTFVLAVSCGLLVCFGLVVDDGHAQGMFGGPQNPYMPNVQKIPQGVSTPAGTTPLLPGQKAPSKMARALDKLGWGKPKPSAFSTPNTGQRSTVPEKSPSSWKTPWKSKPKSSVKKANHEASDLPIARFDLGRLVEKRGDPVKAKLVYTALLRDGLELGRANHRLGVIAAREGEFEKAEHYFRASASAVTPTADLLCDMGYAYYLQSYLAEAEQVLKMALQIEPNHKIALTNLGLVVGQQGRVDDSLKLFRRVTNRPEALANVAYVHTQLGDLRKAEEAYSDALTLNNKLRVAATALLQVKEQKDAQDALVKQRKKRAVAERERRIEAGLPPEVPAPGDRGQARPEGSDVGTNGHPHGTNFVQPSLNVGRSQAPNGHSPQPRYDTQGLSQRPAPVVDGRRTTDPYGKAIRPAPSKQVVNVLKSSRDALSRVISQGSKRPDVGPQAISRIPATSQRESTRPHQSFPIAAQAIPTRRSETVKPVTPYQQTPRVEPVAPRYSEQNHVANRQKEAPPQASPSSPQQTEGHFVFGAPSLDTTTAANGSNSVRMSMKEVVAAHHQARPRSHNQEVKPVNLHRVETRNQLSAPTPDANSELTRVASMFTFTNRNSSSLVKKQVGEKTARDALKASAKQVGSQPLLPVDPKVERPIVTPAPQRFVLSKTAAEDSRRETKAALTLRPVGQQVNTPKRIGVTVQPRQEAKLPTSRFLQTQGKVEPRTPSGVTSRFSMSTTIETERTPVVSAPKVNQSVAVAPLFPKQVSVPRHVAERAVPQVAREIDTSKRVYRTLPKPVVTHDLKTKAGQPVAVYRRQTTSGAVGSTPQRLAANKLLPQTAQRMMRFNTGSSEGVSRSETHDVRVAPLQLASRNNATSRVPARVVRPSDLAKSSSKNVLPNASLAVATAARTHVGSESVSSTSPVEAATSARATSGVDSEIRLILGDASTEATLSFGDSTLSFAGEISTDESALGAIGGTMGGSTESASNGTTSGMGAIGEGR